MIRDAYSLTGSATGSGGGPDVPRGGKDADRFDVGPKKDSCKGGTGRDKDISHPPCEKTSNIP